MPSRQQTADASQLNLVSPPVATLKVERLAGGQEVPFVVLTDRAAGVTLSHMERDDAGRIVMSEAEAETVRAALFVAVHHTDDIVGHCDDCFQTITGLAAQP